MRVEHCRATQSKSNFNQITNFQHRQLPLRNLFIAWTDATVFHFRFSSRSTTFVEYSASMSRGLQAAPVCSEQLLRIRKSRIYRDKCIEFPDAFLEELFINKVRKEIYEKSSDNFQFKVFDSVLQILEFTRGSKKTRRIRVE